MGKAVRCTLRCNEGFTIIEMLIALTLLVIAMVPMAVILETGLKTSVATSNRMHAREVAATEIDKAKSLGFDAVGLQGATLTYDQAVAANNISAAIAPAAGTGLESSSTLTTPAGNVYTVHRMVLADKNSNMTASWTKKVVVNVSWETPKPAGFIELSTLIGATDMAP